MLKKLTSELEPAQTRKLFQLLRSETQLFRGWSKDELFVLADAVVALQVFKNDKLVNKGENVDWYGIVLQGTALVGDARAEGLLRPGDVVGYMGLLQLEGNETHKFNIIIETDGYIAIFQKEDFVDFAKKQAKLAFRLLEAFTFRSLDVINYRYHSARLFHPPRFLCSELPPKKVLELLEKTHDLYVRLVRPLERIELKVFLSLCKVVELQPDQLLIERNSIETSFFIIVEGEILRFSPAKTEILGVGTVLGLPQFVNTRVATPWSNDLRSFKFAVVVMVQRDKFEDVLSQLPQVAGAIYKQVVKEMCLQIVPDSVRDERFAELDRESFNARKPIVQVSSGPAVVPPLYEPLYAFQQLSISSPLKPPPVSDRTGESQFIAEKLNKQKLQLEEEKRQQRLGKATAPIAKKRAAAVAAKKALQSTQTVLIEFKDEYEDALRVNAQLQEEVHRLKKHLEDANQDRDRLNIMLQSQERKLIETAAKKSQVTREVTKIQESGLQTSYQKLLTRSFADVLKEQKRAHRLFALQKKFADKWRDYVRKRIAERERTKRMQFWPTQ